MVYLYLSLYEEPLVLWLIWNPQEGTKTYHYYLTHFFRVMVSLTSCQLLAYGLSTCVCCEIMAVHSMVLLFFLQIAGKQEYRGGRDLRERLDRMRSPLRNSPGRRDAKTRQSSHGKMHTSLFFTFGSCSVVALLYHGLYFFHLLFLLL